MDLSIEQGSFFPVKMSFPGWSSSTAHFLFIFLIIAHLVVFNEQLHGSSIAQSTPPPAKKKPSKFGLPPALRIRIYHKALFWLVQHLCSLQNLNPGYRASVSRLSPHLPKLQGLSLAMIDMHLILPCCGSISIH